MRKNLGGKAMKTAALLRMSSVDEVYLRLVSDWPDPTLLAPGTVETAVVEAALRGAPGTDVERMMFADLMSYLPDDVLVKVDRAPKATSLKTRVPLMDHRVVEFGLGVPASQKLRDGAAKWLLRQVLARDVSPVLLERPKMGFGIPIDHWLRGPLRDWADDMLVPSVLRAHGLEPSPILQAWRERRSSKRDYPHSLWTVLILQSWLSTSSSNRPGEREARTT
jgi:asparagine synthase (glutamine-hydrolysing)